MVRIVKHVVTGFGNIQTTLGSIVFSQDLNLLDMPGSGYGILDILETTKIGALRFITPNILRMAVAEYGNFKSSSLLVVDFDIDSNRTLPILGTYRFDNNISDFLKLLSINIMPSGNIILAGKNESKPFLMSWDGEFVSPRYYTEEICGRDESLFYFSLPIMHRNLIDIETSYSILQDDGTNLIALVNGFLYTDEHGIKRISVDSYGQAIYGFAIFDPNTLDLLAINVSRSGSFFPDIFRPGHIRAGFIGQSDGCLLAQFVGETQAPCCNKNIPVMQDCIIREIDMETLTKNKDRNYKTALGYYEGRVEGDANQASGALVLSSLDDIIFRSEASGFYNLTSYNTLITDAKSIACTFNSGILYSLEATRQGLRLTAYSS